MKKGKLLRTLEHTDDPELLGFDPTGAVLAAVGKKSEVRVWELASGRYSAKSDCPGEGRTEAAVTALAVGRRTKDRSRRARKGSDPSARHRRPERNSRPSRPLDCWVKGSTPHRRGQDARLGVGLGAMRVLRLDLATGQSPLPMRTAMWGICTWIARRTAGSSPRRDLGARWSVSMGKPASASVSSRRPASRPTRGRVARMATPGDRPTRGRVRSGNEHRQARTQDRPRQAREEAGRLVHDLVFAPDGRDRASARGSACGWSRSPRQDLWEDPGGEGKIVFLPGGRWLVTGGWDDKLSVRDLRTGKVESARRPATRHRRHRVSRRRQAARHRPSRWVRLPARPGHRRGPQGMAGPRHRAR